MSWTEKVVAEAKKRISQEEILYRKAYSMEFADYAKEKGMFFSYGDIAHLIDLGLRERIWIRQNGGGAGIAAFEHLVWRFKLYIIQELKTLVAEEKPYCPYTSNQPVDFNFMMDWLDLLKKLDGLEVDLKEIHTKEGGNYG